ncbi:hypothetical protein NJH83_03950 [Pseudomonas chlororaphis]|uniref:hypothetical protein n=1 Tax=Pseudomonas chlororaphis TaxID=587753 RepID=UPI00209AFA5D|nr:hypothetical protein [Pseudomonas chlororaphis]MCO7609373.1 hypothetical protein [Pseudomonas chlororaphis]
MSQKPLCNCKPERLIAQLQSDLNTKDEQINALQAKDEALKLARDMLKTERKRLAESDALLENALDVLKNVDDLDWTGEGVKADIEAALERKPAQSPLDQFSALREAMENVAARGNPCQLIVGATHVAVTYHGIKWIHSKISADKPPHPLAIEEFDEIVANALGGKQ